MKIKIMKMIKSMIRIMSRNGNKSYSYSYSCY